MRPANIITAVSDVLAGIAIAGYFTKGAENISILPVLFLCISTIGLYGGGVVLNDVFDAKLDAVERPERPIPSGLIAKKSAALLGVFLLLIGTVAAAFVHPSFIHPSTLIAVGIAIASVVYDSWGKHHALLGPLNMGLCRGLNQLLGVSIVTNALQTFWPLGLVPVVYIAAVTTISRGEVNGGRKSVLYFAAFLYSLVLFSILAIAYQNGNLLPVLVLICFFAFAIFRPLYKAVQQPVGANIGKAVKAGVLSLILMNAAWAVAFGQPYLALAILFLLPLSLALAKLFAVT